jgi:hypothetical protein
MAWHQCTGTETAAVHADAPAENLFFGQYRYWMAGYSARDRFCWDLAWDALLRFVAPDSAKLIYSEFYLFTRALCEQANRAIGRRPDVCRCLCRDEYLVLALVEASQRKDFVRERSAATELLGTEKVHVLLMASRSLAQTLKVRKFVLAPVERQPAMTTMPQIRQVHTLH